MVAKAPDADVFMLLQGVAKPQGQTVRDVALSHMQAAGFRRGARGPHHDQRARGLRRLYRGQIEGIGDVTSRAAHIAHGRAVFGGGLGARGGFDQADAFIARSIRRFGR